MSIICRYDDPEIALHCGAMFRDCIRHEPVARLVLESTIFTDMFGRLEMSNFEVASGALRRWDLFRRPVTI